MKTLKAILTITLATLAFSACTSDVENEAKRTPVKLRSQTEAINIAENAYSAFNSGKGSRAGHAKTAQPAMYKSSKVVLLVEWPTTLSSILSTLRTTKVLP